MSNLSVIVNIIITAYVLYTDEKKTRYVREYGGVCKLLSVQISSLLVSVCCSYYLSKMMVSLLSELNYEHR